MHLSTRKVLELKEIVGERIFNLPNSMANHIDIVTGDPCIYTQINGQKYYIPTEKPTPIPYVAFCVLKDLGILNYYNSYDQGDTF